MTVTRRHDAQLCLGRRQFLTLGAGSFLGVVATWRHATLQSPDSLPGTGPSGRLWDPARAGRPLPPVTAADNDAAIQVIEKQIHCTCGCNLDVYTCRTTDFACTVSPAMHADVMGLVAGGHTAQEILAAFNAVYGEKVLMAPVKSGFNLVGYTMPFVALGAGAVMVSALIKRWKARTPTPAVVTTKPVDATEREL